MEEIIFRSLESKFVKVRCKKCGHEQVIFDRASNKIKCLNCGELLAEPTGGKAKIYGEIVDKYY